MQHTDLELPRHILKFAVDYAYLQYMYCTDKAQRGPVWMSTVSFATSHAVAKNRQIDRQIGYHIHWI